MTTVHLNDNLSQTNNLCSCKKERKEANVLFKNALSIFNYG